jgi:hypothetical protein
MRRLIDQCRGAHDRPIGAMQRKTAEGKRDVRLGCPIFKLLNGKVIDGLGAPRRNHHDKGVVGIDENEPPHIGKIRDALDLVTRKQIRPEAPRARLRRDEQTDRQDHRHAAGRTQRVCRCKRERCCDLPLGPVYGSGLTLSPGFDDSGFRVSWRHLSPWRVRQKHRVLIAVDCFALLAEEIAMAIASNILLERRQFVSTLAQELKVAWREVGQEGQIEAERCQSACVFINIAAEDVSKQKTATRCEVMVVVVVFGKRSGSLRTHQPSKCRGEKHTRTAGTIEDALLQRIASGERLFDHPIRQQPRRIIGPLFPLAGCAFAGLRFRCGLLAEERFVDTGNQFDWNLREIITPNGGLTGAQHGATQEMVEILERI